MEHREKRRKASCARAWLDSRHRALHGHRERPSVWQIDGPLRDILVIGRGDVERATGAASVHRQSPVDVSGQICAPKPKSRARMNPKAQPAYDSGHYALPSRKSRARGFRQWPTWAAPLSRAERAQRARPPGGGEKDVEPAHRGAVHVMSAGIGRRSRGRDDDCGRSAGVRRSACATCSACRCRRARRDVGRRDDYRCVGRRRVREVDVVLPPFHAFASCLDVGRQSIDVMAECSCRNRETGSSAASACASSAVADRPTSRGADSTGGRKARWRDPRRGRAAASSSRVVRGHYALLGVGRTRRRVRLGTCVSGCTTRLSPRGFQAHARAAFAGDQLRSSS